MARLCKRIAFSAYVSLADVFRLSSEMGHLLKRGDKRFAIVKYTSAAEAVMVQTYISFKLTHRVSESSPPFHRCMMCKNELIEGVDGFSGWSNMGELEVDFRPHDKIVSAYPLNPAIPQ
jgi:hypothetical protein